VDGMAGRAVREMLIKGELPAIQRLRREGAWTHNARTDFFNTTTVANHTCILTGLPSGHTPGFPAEVHHGYTHNTMPEPGKTIHNKGNPSLDYVPSIFDVAHDFGLKTCLFSSKPKFVLYERSYDAEHGAADPIAPDNGKDKIDLTVLEVNTEDLVRRFIEQQESKPCNLTLLHLADPDATGHGSGWGSDEYLQSLRKCDGLIGKLLDQIEKSPALRGQTALVVTSDHGGFEKHHLEHDRPENFVIPFYLWAKGIPGGKDLYDLMSPHRKDPGDRNPSYRATPPPIRNGDAGNLALDLLGLPPVPGSLMFIPGNG
jgi:predicted AlkP superfamily pyrophosphatase or phosphodiesterase